MTRRKVAGLTPFAFQADFSTPQENAPSPEGETVTIPVADLAAIGAQLRAEAEQAARAPLDAAAQSRLEDAISRLGMALSDLSALVETLDAAGRTGALPAPTAELARMAARRIVDGQGDLFAACKALASKTDI